MVWGTRSIEWCNGEIVVMINLIARLVFDLMVGINVQMLKKKLRSLKSFLSTFTAPKGILQSTTM